MEKPAEDPFTYFLPELLQSPRIKDIIEELERQLAKDEETGRKAVVMSYNNVVYHVIHLVCKSNGINSAIFISSNPKRPNERASKIEEFNKDQYSDPHVLVCSVGIAKRGYNMVEANLLIMVDLDWNLAASEQAKCRENRVGQKRRVRIVRYYSGGVKLEHDMLEKEKLGNEALKSFSREVQKMKERKKAEKKDKEEEGEESDGLEVIELSSEEEE